MNQYSLGRVFNEDIAARIVVVAEDLHGKSEFHNPMVWRAAIPALAGLDFVKHSREGIYNTMRLMEAFRLFGRLSLDLRDVPGLGHGRVLTLPQTRHHFSEPLELIASGKSFAAICITEEHGGSDLHALQTTATRKGGGYQLNGRKMFISRLRQADIYIVFARVAGLDHGLTVFMLPANTPGLHIVDIPSLGLKGNSWGTLYIENVYVEKYNRVGGEGQGFSLFSNHFSFWRCAMAAAAIGAAESVLDKTKLWLQTRQAFSGAIGRFSHLQQEYAKHASRSYMAWLLVKATAERMDAKLYSYVDGAMTKAESVEAAIAAVQWGMQVHGAYGYSAAAGIEKILRDLLGLRIADGTHDVLRGQVARGLLGEELYALSLGRDANSHFFFRERQLW